LWTKNVFLGKMMFIQLVGLFLSIMMTTDAALAYNTFVSVIVEIEVSLFTTLLSQLIGYTYAIRSLALFWAIDSLDTRDMNQLEIVLQSDNEDLKEQYKIRLRQKAKEYGYLGSRLGLPKSILSHVRSDLCSRILIGLPPALMALVAIDAVFRMLVIVWLIAYFVHAVIDIISTGKCPLHCSWPDIVCNGLGIEPYAAQGFCAQASTSN
jgi:hypothetical protein